MTATNEQFITALKDSQRGVAVIAAYYMRKGYTCVLPALKIRPDYSQRFDFQDDGDFFVHQRIEVKHRSFNFSGRHDYPYADNVIVCEQHTHDNATPKPFNYFILSQDEKCAAVIPTRTQSNWIVQPIWNRRWSENRVVYCCPLDLVRFINLEDNGND